GGLRRRLGRQYRGLSARGQQLLAEVPGAGRAIATVELANLLGLHSGVVTQASLGMLDRGVGRVEEGRLSFKNELHRAYVYYAMGEDRRRYHHAQLAQRLASSEERNDLQPLLELVHHFISAGMHQPALE